MNEDEILSKLLECVETGKVNRNSPYPPHLKGMDGADELTRMALDKGIRPARILNDALIMAMERVGQKYAEKKIFVPQMLVSAKAMNTAMAHLKPYFQSGEVKRRGSFIIGTVSGDLHDIGKNLVAMIVEGAGWEVIDLGVDVSAEKFIQAAASKPGAIVGLSALLTTTMVNMKSIVSGIRTQLPGVKVIIGGAPVNENFRNEIGADAYAQDPQGAVAFLNSIAA
jgi:5-methyltetrahydrofolate--homocysteine methyltransferase